MIKRILSAAILVPLVVWLVIFAPQIYFSIFILIVATTAYIEWVNINPDTDSFKRVAYTLFAFVATFSLIFYSPYTLYILIFLFILHMIANFRDTSKENTLLSYYLFGGVQYVMLYAFLPLIMHTNNGRYILMTLFISIWMGDTLAYFCGKSFGERKLAEKISPKKTVLGAVCGIVGGTVSAAVAGYVFGIPVSNSIAIGLVANITGLFGDLAESVIKRAFNRKDSSNLIPGHGGILDRLDSVAFAGFFVYILVLWKIL